VSDESLELVKAAAEGGASAFIETVLGPLVEAGEWGRDVIRRQRVKTQIKTLVLANEMLQREGIAATAIDLKTLVPMLDGASLEADDEEEMVVRWAALLANAAAGPDAGSDVIPAFPAILRELRPIDAMILDELAQQRRTSTSVFRDLVDAEDPDAEPTVQRVQLALENLERAGVCRVEWNFPELNMTVDVTGLGVAFVAACTPPTGARSGAHVGGDGS
jgi:hypothetical protein